MRYRSPHAAGGGRVPLALRGPKPARTALAAAVAGAIGLVPVVMVATPAFAAVNVALANTSAVEGQNLVFTLNYTGSTAATYNLSFGGGTSTATGGGTDYTAPATTTVTFAGSGAPAQTITVPTTDDKLYEPDETVEVTATNAGDATDTITAVGTIIDNDTAPSYTLSATPNPVDENAGTTSITATLSAPSGMTTTIALSTTNGTAVAGTNFNSSLSSIVIAPGATTGSSPLTVMNDALHDATSPMNLTVNGIGDNVTGKAQSLQVGIADVQPMPKVTISAPAATAEGNNAAWTVSTDTPSAQAITVNWDALPTTPVTGHGAATPGDDFTYPASGRTVTIPAGQLSVPLSIPLIDDSLNELPEDYTIGISNPVNAVLGAGTKAVSTITDVNTTAPTVSITPTAVTEGDSGKRTQTFTATLTGAKSGRTVTVNWNTADDTAVQGYDYVAASGQLVFPVGTTSQTFTVDIIGDKIYEPGNERFDIQLAAPVGETPTSFNVVPDNYITITDDDTIPTATVGDVSVKEGDIVAPVLVPIKLSNPSSQNVVVTVTDTPTAPTSNTVSMTPGANDYTLLNNTVTIPAGQLTGYAVILVNGDNVYEPDESTSLAWSATNVGAPSTGTATFTILNDDKAPNLEVNSVSGKEGDTVDVTGTVTGMSQDDTWVTVTFTGTSVDGKAAANANDFVNPGAKVVYIPAGTAPDTVLPIASIKLNDDTDAEPAETILASGVGNNGVGSVTDGAITILASDGGTTPPPTGGLTIMAPSWVTGAVAVPITGKATAGATVELWGAPWSTASANPTKLASTTAGSDGSYKFSRWIGTGYVFQTAVGDQMSNTVKVGIKEAPVFIASSPSTGKLYLAVQGNPRGPKQTVIVQAWVGGKWVNTWKGMTGTNDLWKATVSQKSKSSWTLRAFVQGNMNVGINGGYSAAKKVTIK